MKRRVPTSGGKAILACERLPRASSASLSDRNSQFAQINQLSIGFLESEIAEESMADVKFVCYKAQQAWKRNRVVF